MRTGGVEKKNGAKTGYTIGIDNGSPIPDVLSPRRAFGLTGGTPYPGGGLPLFALPLRGVHQFLKQCDTWYGLNLMSDG